MNLLSYCLPCHRRSQDLVASLPYAIRAANASPPVQIVIVDYGDQPSLMPLVGWVAENVEHISPGVQIHVHIDRSRADFHMAHARNISIRQAGGDHIMIASADFLPHPNLFAYQRGLFASGTLTWAYPARYKGAIVCARQELVDAGGYDERFEFYGPEDKELHARLLRRGSLHGIYPSELLDVISTPDDLKVKHYRLPLNKREMHLLGKPILEDSEQQQRLIANEGVSWGL